MRKLFNVRGQTYKVAEPSRVKGVTEISSTSPFDVPVEGFSERDKFGNLVIGFGYLSSEEPTVEERIALPAIATIGARSRRLYRIFVPESITELEWKQKGAGYIRTVLSDLSQKHSDKNAHYLLIEKILDEGKDDLYIRTEESQ